MLRWLSLMLLATLAFALPAHAQDKRIALTFDDVPRQAGGFLTPDQRTRLLIAALKRAGVKQAAFFVNPGRLATPDGRNGARHIAAYVAAGHVIGNHSYSHEHLNALTADAYLADIDRASRWLKGRKGYRPWFRFPFLDEGYEDKAKRDAVRAGLKQRGLLNAYVTVDGSDWSIESLAAQAVKAGKPLDMPALKDLYVGTMVGAADFYDDLARRTIGRSPAHVILMHETDLAAMYITDVVAALRKDGWMIITAEEAYRDPIAQVETDTPIANGTRTEMMAWQAGLPKPRWYERDNVTFANRLFEERVLQKKVPNE